MVKSLLSEFKLDWRLSGKSDRTAKEYVQHLEGLLTQFPDPNVSEVKLWISYTESQACQRRRGQAPGLIL